MEELIKDFECHLTLMADDLHDIVSHSNSIVQYIKEHEGEWSRSGTGNNVQITPIGNEGRRIARYKIDDNPEGYIYAPTTTSGLNGDTTIIEPLNFSGSKVAIANFVAGNESGTLYAPAGGGSGGNGGNDGQDGLSTLFAFRGFANDSAAENDWSLIKNSLNYPPSGWSTSSNVTIQEGHMLYMTTAQRQGNNYITTNGAVWQKPVRIGSGSDTSHTGTDDDNYSYIYCRTISGALPGLTGNPNTSSYGVELLNLIENNDKKYGFKPDGGRIDLSSNSISASDIDRAWTDHPYGVSSQLPFEWQVGFKKNEESGNWKYYFGPVIVSHYGHDGLDGDGLEYIFYLLSKSLAGVPSLSAPYDGSVTKNGTTTNYTNVLINSANYQLDDFIPTGWYDNPQTVSEEYPRQYVSIRKKDGSQEANNLWKAFSTPRLWNVYATNGFLATLDNDSIILDDDNGSEAIEFVSLTKIFLWDGANDVTLSNNYAKVTVTINCIGFTNELKPGLVTSTANNNVVISSDLNKSGWGTAIQINKNNYLGFALTKVANGNPKLSTGTGSITYTIRAYKNINDATPTVEASRILTILVIDINDGVAYLLQVTPNTLGIERANDSSPYTLRNGNSSIVATATAATETSVENIEIKNGSTNASDGDLYIVVSDSGGSPLNIANNDISYNSNVKSLTYNLATVLSGKILSSGNNGIHYITVDLYYKYNGTGIKVDSETVDFSVKGDKGQDGSGTGTESYVVTTLNDNAVIDDLTTTDYALREATLYTLTVYKGSTNVTNNCRFVPSNVTLPTVSNSQQLILGIRSSNQTEYLDPTDYNLNNVNTFVLYAANGVTNITPGSYYYDINIYHNSTLVATKRFKLYVDANISSDGSFYKLCMENDVVYYIYDGTALSEGYVIMTPRKIKGNSTQQQSIYKIVQNINNEQNIDSSKLYLEVGNLYSICSINNNGLALISRAHISYNVDGYDGITLYKGNLYVDGPERIECIKYGSPGGTGEDAYTITSNNDNSILDDLILSNSALASVTTQTFTVYKGSLDITSSCSYQVTNINLNSSDLKVLSYSSGSWSDATNSSVLGMNLFRIQLVPTPDPVYTEITKGEYYYDVVITHGSYSATKRHKITVKDISFGGGVGALYNLNFEPDGVMYDEDGEVLSTTNSVITVYDRNTEQSYQPVETLPESSIDSTRYYVVLGPLYSRIVRLQLEQSYDSSYEWEGNTRIKFKKYEINRATVPYVAGGYPVLLYKGSELIDGPEIFSCIKVKRDTSIYNLETYPTSLKFNVASDGATLTPSELVARCKISKKVGNNDYIFSNNNIDGYCLYYNITNASGLLVNLSGVPTGNYVIYNNDDAAIAGIHISNLDLNYILVNFYLSKAKTTDLLTQQGDLYYTNDISPIIKQVSVPILRDGLKGDSSSTGQTGRFYYFAGDWEGDVTSSGLKVTNYSYPYVYYLGSYYMYVGDPSSTNPYMITKANLLGTGNDITMSDNWKEMTYNKFVVSEAMFANYAKLGAAIFNRDWMISQYGSIGGTPSTNYTSFDPVEFMNAIKGYAEIGVVLGGGLAPLGESGSSYNILSQLFKLPLNNYTITVTLSGSSNSGKSVRLVKFNDLDLFKDISKVSIITSGNSANASTETPGTCSNGTTITLNALTSGNYVYCLLANNSSSVDVTNIKVEITGSYTAFIPNYALDLRSGLTYLNNAYVKGLVSTVNDLVVLKEENLQVGSLGTLNKRGLFCRNDKSNLTSKILASMYTTHYDNDGTSNFNEEGIVELKSNNERYRHHITSRSINLSLYNITDNPGALIEESTIDSSGGNFPIINTKSVSNNFSPVAFPGNIDLGTTVTLPRSSSIPYSGTVIFATNCKEVKILEDVPVFRSDGLGDTYNSNESSIIGTYPANNTYIFDTVSPRIFVGYYVNRNLKWREFMCRQ